MIACNQFTLRFVSTLLASGSLIASNLAAPPVAASQQAGVLIDFYPGSKVRPRQDRYQLVITDLGEKPPTVSREDPSEDVPGLTGSFGANDADAGSIILKLDGRSDDTTGWIGDTWTGGESCLIKGSESGLGIGDRAGGNKVDGAEVIIWSFDVSSLSLDPGESLVMTAVNFGGEAEGEHAQFWRRTGRAGSKGAGTRIATGGVWTGRITIANGDEFALAGNGRLRSITLNISSPKSEPAPGSTASVQQLLVAPNAF